MSNEKDHLGEKLRHKEKVEEDRYFSELSKKQLEKLRERREEAHAAGHGSCPRCGAKLEIVHHKDVAIDSCPNQHGVWLDSGELEEITKREGPSWLARLLRPRL